MDIEGIFLLLNLLIMLSCPHYCFLQKNLYILMLFINYQRLSSQRLSPYMDCEVLDQERDVLSYGMTRG